MRRHQFHSRARSCFLARALGLWLCWWILTIPAASFAQTLLWERLTEGLAVAVWHPESQCPEIPSFLVIDIDPQRYRFAVHSYRSDGFSTPPDIHQWQERTGHELIFNAGLFREDYSYLGLLYAKGRSLGGKRHATWMGLFVAEPVDSASPPAQVLDLTVDPFDEQRPTYREAAQSLMLFDRTGSIRVRQSGKRSQQTVLSEQSNGHIWLLKSTDAVSLYAIGHCLRETFPEIREAMAMDGGSSSDMALSALRRQAAGKSSGAHSWLSLLDDSSTVHIGLPTVIGISLRDEIKAIPAVKDKPARR